MPRFNVKLFLGLIVATVLVVAGLFVVNRLQTARIARAFLQQAERAESEGKQDAQVRFLTRYLELVPSDVEARARLAQTLASDKVASNVKARFRALFALEQVLARLPERRDLRFRLAQLAFELQRRDLAREHLQRLTQDGTADAEAEFLLGRLAESDGAWAKAASWYRRAIEHAPRQIEAYVRLADILRRRLGPDQKAENARAADGVIAALVAANPEAHQAHLGRWRYLKQWADLKQPEKLDEAAGHVERAFELAPGAADVLLAASDLAQARDQADKSRALLQQAHKLFPGDPRMVRELALLELHENQPNDAIACLRIGAPALKGQARFEILWMLANLQLDQKQSAEAAATLAEMAKAAATPASLDYIQARLHILDGRWPAAVQLLERNRELFSGTPELARQTDLFLAQCYEKLDNPDLQLAAMNRIVGQDPTSVQGLLGKAAAQRALGQIEEAILQYQQIVKLPEAPKSAWIELARLLLARNLQTERRGTALSAVDWKTVEEATDRAVLDNPRAPEAGLLAVELLFTQIKRHADRPEVVKQKTQRAQEVLEQLKSEWPQRADVWAALAALAELRGQADEAVRTWEEAECQVGDSAALRQVKARFWGRRGGPEARDALQALAQEIERFSAAERGPLLTELAETSYRFGARAEAVRLWLQLAELPMNKNEVRVRYLLFELALQSGDDASMQRWLGELERIEGDAGVFWRYCTARRRISQAQQGQRQGLDEARRLLDAVAAKRPAWSVVPVAQGDLDALAGNPEQAIANYRRAIQLGERNPRVVRKLVQQLYQRQRFDEAEQEIQKLQKQLPSRDLQRLAVDIHLHQQDPVRAVGQALDTVAADSTDFRDHLWLGQVLTTSAKHAAQAEQHLRQATELGAEQPETWIALVQFLVGSRKTREAEEAVAQAQGRLPAERAALALAVCHETLGQPDRAEEFYKQLQAARPADAQVLRHVAGFYLRSKRLALAEPLLRSVIDGKVKAPPGDVAGARRSLALALAGDNRRFADALALVGLAGAANGSISEKTPLPADDAVEELRTRVRVLARQPRGPVRRKAIALLEDLGKRQALAADDRFVLAQLYEADGSWPQARAELRQLTVQGKNPSHLKHYALALCRQRELADAERVVSRLEQLEKDRQVETGALGSVELRALIGEARGQGDKAVQLLQEHARRKPDDLERSFALIGLLTRQKRFLEVLDLCTQLQSAATPERLAEAAVGALRVGQAGPEPCQRVAEQLQADLEKDPKSISLRLQLADLEDLRGRYDEVQQIYREVLTLEPNQVVALNNLAWFLGQQRASAAEALPLINRAIELAGPQADLLDTRASVYLTLGRSAQAIADLETANADRPAPMRYFHLAQAQQSANNAQAAAALLKKATAAGLKAEQLHPVERVAFLQMLRALEQR